MTSIEAGEQAMIDPQHPFFGGRMGIFEFMIGEDDEIAVFSKPPQYEGETKIFFMVRPEDQINHLNYISTIEDRNVTSDFDDQVCRWLDQEPPNNGEK